MRKLIYVLPLLILFSCDKKEELSQGEKNQEQKKEIVINSESSELLGEYAGYMRISGYDSDKDYKYNYEGQYFEKVILDIKKLNKQSFAGTLKISSYDRAGVDGKVEFNEFEYKFEIDGDIELSKNNNGKFQFELNIKDKQITGTWVAFDQKVTVPERELFLEKRIFKYNPNLEIPRQIFDTYLSEYSDVSEENLNSLLLNPSIVALKSHQLENLYKQELELLRNSIFARHGFIFKTEKFSDFFNNFVPWYIPTYEDVSKDITELEMKNIELIKRYESHARKHEFYGR